MILQNLVLLHALHLCLLRYLLLCKTLDLQSRNRPEDAAGMI